MRILALGDMQWNSRRILRLLRQSGAKTLLLAGDINEHTGDRQTWKRVSPGFRSIARLGVRLYSIRGNWDECEEYDRAFQSAPAKIRDISDTVVDCAGITIAGMSWFTSYSLPLLRESVQKLRLARPDILVAHAPLKRRVWLLEARPRLIVSGHCPPNEHTKIGGTIFVSLCGSVAHAIIDITKRKVGVTIWEDGRRIPRFVGEGSLWNGRQFRVMRALREARSRLDPGQWISPALTASLRRKNVPIHAINEYLSPNVRKALRPNYFPVQN